MPVATRRELLEAGVHFGHQTRRWNPKMRRYIFGERSGIYIIDLEKSLQGVEHAHAFLRDIGRRHGTVLFVGTKKQAQEVVADQARRVGMPFVNTRWLGGMLTNFQTIHDRLRRLKELREMDRGGVMEFLPKKEALRLRHEQGKLERNLSGIIDMDRLPDALFVIDTKKEHIAVTEARRLGIPIVAIVDTNCDQDQVAEPEIEEEQAPVEAAPEPEARPVKLSEDEAAWMGESIDESAAKPDDDVVEIEAEPASAAD